MVKFKTNSIADHLVEMPAAERRFSHKPPAWRFFRVVSASETPA
jgi:hypothetical protein